MSVYYKLLHHNQNGSPCLESGLQGPYGSRKSSREGAAALDRGRTVGEEKMRPRAIEEQMGPQDLLLIRWRYRCSGRVKGTGGVGDAIWDAGEEADLKS